MSGLLRRSPVRFRHILHVEASPMFDEMILPSKSMLAHAPTPPLGAIQLLLNEVHGLVVTFEVGGAGELRLRCASYV